MTFGIRKLNLELSNASVCCLRNDMFGHFDSQTHGHTDTQTQVPTAIAYTVAVYRPASYDKRISSILLCVTLHRLSKRIPDVC